MRRSLLLVALMVLGLAVPPAAAADNDAELVRLIAAYGKELARVENYLAWYDQVQRLEVAQGRASSADADARLRARGEQLYRQSFADADLAQIVAQHRQAAEGYFAMIAQAVAAAPQDSRTALTRMLEARRTQYEAFASQGLDPLPVLSGMAAVHAAARGDTAPDPFQGQRERILAALPDPELARLAASAATVFGETWPPAATTTATVPVTPVTPPPAQAAEPVTIVDFAWVGKDSDRTSQISADTGDGQKDGHFRLRLRASGVQELRSIAVHTTDEAGTLAHGQHWHTANGTFWILALAFKDRPVNRTYRPSLGRYRGTFTLDLFAADSGYFKSGQTFVVEVETASGTVRRLTRLGTPTAAARPVPGEMTAARPVPGEMGKPRPIPGQMGKPAATATVPQPASGIRVVHGTYGANCGVRQGNVTEHLRQACDGRDKCEYLIDVGAIGDPAYGCEKDYAAQWDCVGQPGHHVLTAPPEAGRGDRLLILGCDATTPPPRGVVTRSDLDLPVSGLTAEECRMLCDRETGCVSFTFLKAAADKPSACLASSRVPEQLAGRR